MVTNSAKVLFILLLVSFEIKAQECRNIILASKAFPSSDSKVIWNSNRPVEYLYPGENVHVIVTGDMDFMPTHQSADKGGIGPFFKSRVEWDEHHPLKPKDKEPKFTNLNLTSEHSNEDGSYECNLSVPIDATGLTKQVVLEVKVLESNELSGSGGLTTGEYIFQLTIDNSNRFQLVSSEIRTHLVGWSFNAIANLDKLIKEDDRLKCKYHDELAEIILNTSAGVTSKEIKQQVLQYASSLSPQNHDITIALAQTYTGEPGGCEKQIKALSDNGITQINVDPSDFKIISNSAKAFEILASAYFDCNDNFRDAKSVDSLRNFYRLASKQYGLVFNYPKQIEMAIDYANAELDYNDKTEIQNAATFLEEIWQTIPRNIDSVSEEERQAFFGKFGNTHFVEYRNIKDSIRLKFKQQNNVERDFYSDEVTFTFKKINNSLLQLNYGYTDRYRSIQNGLRVNNYLLKAILNNKFKIVSIQFDSTIESNPNSPLNIEKITTNNILEIKNNLPEVISSFIRIIDIPTFCPKAEINGNSVTHNISHLLGNIKLHYFIPEALYSIRMDKSLPFIILSNSFSQLSQKKNTPKTSKDHLIINKDADPTLIDNSGISWGVVDITFN